MTAPHFVFYPAYAFSWRAVLCLCCTVTSAQAAPDNLAELKKLPIANLFNIQVYTPSKNNEDINNTPSTLQVITREQIEQRRYINLVDLLEDLPGVDVFRRTKATLYNNISFRGHLTNTKFLILQDGIRIEDATGGNVAVADNFPLAHAKQVEVLYGPAAALYGADAFAGIVNIITQDGEDIDGARLSSSFGSDGYRYYQAVAGGKSGDVNISLAAHVHRADTEDLSKRFPEDFPKVDATTFDGRVIVPAAQREDYAAPVSSESFFAKAKYQDWLEAGVNYSLFQHLTSTGDRPDTALFLEEAEWNTRIFSVYSRVKHDINEDLDVQFSWDYNYADILPGSKFYNIYVDFQDYGYEYAQSDRHAFELQANYQLNKQHSLISGLVYEKHYVLPQVPDLPQPYNTDVGLDQQNLNYPYTDLPIQFFDAHYQTHAVYLQWQANWSEKLSSNVGLRYDNHSSYGSTWNPRLGLVYKYSPDTVLKMLYGESFRAPYAEGLSTFGTFTGEQLADGRYVSNFFRAPNFDLEPEKARNIEISLSKAFSSDLNLSAALYYTKVDNLIVTASQAEADQFIPGAYIKYTNVKANAGKEYHYGADLSLSYRRKLGTGWQGNFWANYSYAQGSIMDSEGSNKYDLAYITPHKLKLGATFSHHDWFITPKLYLMGPANTSRNDALNPGERIKTPGYVLAHLHIGKQRLFLDNLSAHLDIYNLFDTHYYNAAGSASTTFVNMPQPGRAFVFSLQYQF